MWKYQNYLFKPVNRGKKRVGRSELPLQVCKQNGFGIIQSLELVDKDKSNQKFDET